MEADTLHHLLSSEVALRTVVNQHAAPSNELINHIRWMIPRQRKTAEIGVSTLSIYLARIASDHLCIVPTEAAEELSQVLDGSGVDTGALTILAADGPAALAHIPDGSIDTVVLSCNPAFPAYFAWCHEALRILRIGGRLIVRGVGIWTIEQFKNHLRIDPRFVGWSVIAPDAILVGKHAETQDVAWSKQPFLIVNSNHFDEATVRRAQSHPLNAGIETFSTVASETARSKVGRRDVPDVGLVGYYGFGNYGDELFRTCFEQGLPDVRLRVLTDLPRRPYILGDRKARVDQVDAILIGGGDLLIPGYWPDPYLDEVYLNKPVFVHGVGVPRWSGGDPKVIQRMRAFMQHPNVRHINVRDVESQDWVRTHLQPTCPVDMAPDMVFGLDLDHGQPNGARDRQDLSASPTLVLITRSMGAKDDSYTALRNLVTAAQASGIRVNLLIAGVGSIGDDDLSDAVKRDLGCDRIVRATTIEAVTAEIRDADMIVSMKFHGCVVGLMTGKPTYGLIQTDKFVNLYRALKLDGMALSFTDPAVAQLLDHPPISVDSVRLSTLREEAKAAMATLNQRIWEAVPVRRTLSKR